MKEVQFILTIEEANQILGVLGNCPFNQVNALIAKLREQGNKQLEEKPKDDKVSK